MNEKTFVISTVVIAKKSKEDPLIYEKFTFLTDPHLKNIADAIVAKGCTCGLGAKIRGANGALFNIMKNSTTNQQQSDLRNYFVQDQDVRVLIVGQTDKDIFELFSI